MGGRIALLAGAACGALFAAGGAVAQTSATPGAAPEQGEIIVTATRRAQALADVPIAVSAISAESLANSGVTDIRALNQLAPSLIVSGATSEVNFTARIRGIGTVGENPGLESSVALFIDGVYRSRTGVGLTEIGEIERVEVLRGPQGTLFGRNASAGLINIVTASPKFDFGGYGAATYGNYDYLRLEGGVTGPLVADKVAAKLEGVYMRRDGQIENVTPGQPDLNDRDRYLVRGQFLLTPTDDVRVRLIGDYGRRDELCCGAVYLQPVRNVNRVGTDVVVAPNALLPILQSLGANIQLGEAPFVRRTATTPGFLPVSKTEEWGVSGELTWDFANAELTSITAYRDYKNLQGQDSDYNALDILRRTDLQRRFRTFSQEVRLNGTAFNDRLDWLVGGYYAYERLDVRDDIKYGADYERYANCVLLAGVLPAAVLTSDPLCVNRPVLAGAGAASGNPILLALNANPARPGFGSIAAALGQPNIAINNTGVVDNRFRQNSRNYAFFTHNVFQLVPDRLLLTLGARYTNERKDVQSRINQNSPLCSLVVNSPFQALAALPCVINGLGVAFNGTEPNTTRREDEWTGTAVLSFKPDDDLLLYASYARGYKAGGFNLDNSALDRPCNTTFDASCAARLALPVQTPGNGRPEAADLTFNAEKVDAFELGAKFNGRQFDLNIAAFYSRFTDYQLNTFNGVNFEVTNIAGCRDGLNGADRDASPATGGCAPNRLKPGVVSKGVEIEAFAYPLPDLQFNAAATILDSKYADNLTGTNGRPLSPVLFQLPGQPTFGSRYAITGGASWTPALRDALRALFYADFRYSSKVNTGSDLDIEKEQPGFLVVNARVGLLGDERRWSLEFWAQNLLNETYQQIGADAPLQGGGTYQQVARGLAASANGLFVAFPGEPRTYGVTARFRF